jgi:hypothetical protein
MNTTCDGMAFEGIQSTCLVCVMCDVNVCWVYPITQHVVDLRWIDI